MQIYAIIWIKNAIICGNYNSFKLCLVSKSGQQMLKLERRAYILHQVDLHNKVLLTDLSQQMNVSYDTIRRDLQDLSEEGKIIKVHGGALSPSFHNGSYGSKEVYAYSQKKIIAKKAASLVKNGMFVLTGGGTTIIEFAKALPHELHATFISGSVPALFHYISHPNIEVIAIGDKIAKNSMITVGSEAISRIRNLKVDLCFLGVNAINPDTGISDNEWEVTQVKKAMIESSRLLICLTIAEKLNSQQPFQVCNCKRIHTLVTELPPDDPLLQPYVQAGISVL
jgi:DeoR/GlpR family transcriptional regulator of sugar metabolism